MHAHAALLEDSDHDSSPPSPPGGTWAPILSWLARRNTPLTVAAGLLAPILYLVYVNRYAVNALQGDDWNMIPLGVHQALHGHLSLSQLWSQYSESRILLVRVVIDLFAFTDRFNTRSVIFFNAALYVAAYAILLALCRAYLAHFERRLTPIPVVLLGLVWFSLADVQNALWADQMLDYLLVVFFVAMLFALQVPKSHRRLWFCVAVIAAIMASISFLPGFMVWPLGAICILWSRPWVRQTTIEIATWIAVASLTGVFYFLGFNLQVTGCIPSLGCTPHAAFSDPLSGLHFFVVLIGNVIPGGYFGAPSAPTNFVRYDVVGGALCIVALYILIQSWRERDSVERFPLPLLLIGFSLLWDAIVTLGRTGEGLFGAVNSNRYVFPDLILLSGIVLYTWGHMPSWRLSVSAARGKVMMAWLPALLLAVFLGVQVVTATEFGLNNGPLERAWLVDGARLAVNLKEIPLRDQQCERATYYIPTSAIIGEAEEDHLGEFEPNSQRFYRQLGPPAIPLHC